MTTALPGSWHTSGDGSGSLLHQLRLLPRRGIIAIMARNATQENVRVAEKQGRALYHQTVVAEAAAAAAVADPTLAIAREKDQRSIKRRKADQKAKGRKTTGTGSAGVKRRGSLNQKNVDISQTHLTIQHPLPVGMMDLM